MLFLAMKSLTFLSLSPSFTAITFRFGLAFNFFSCGTSSLQMGHHVAQNTTTTVFLPMYWIREIFSPSGAMSSRSPSSGFSAPVAAIAWTCKDRTSIVMDSTADSALINLWYDMQIFLFNLTSLPHSNCAHEG